MIAWAIAGGGMYILARVFQTLAERKPDLDAGVFAYAKAGFGDYSGLIKATLGTFFPASAARRRFLRARTSPWRGSGFP